MKLSRGAVAMYIGLIFASGVVLGAFGVPHDVRAQVDIGNVCFLEQFTFDTVGVGGPPVEAGHELFELVFAVSEMAADTDSAGEPSLGCVEYGVEVVA